MDQEIKAVDYEQLKQALLTALEPLNDLRLDPALIKMGAKLGSGGFGDIFHATRKIRTSWYKSARASVVVKRLRAEGTDEQRLRIVVALARELVVWSRFNHPNVLRLLGFYFDDTDFTYACAVTEWQEHGNILSYVQRTKPDQDRLLELIQDSASGIAYLHSLKPPVCHGDIKPENTLVNQLGRALICDFGLAKAVDDRPSGLTTTAQPFTARYASPEVLQDASVRTLPSDVWSWGCLVYHLVFKQIPYHEMGSLGAIYAAATTGHPPATFGTDTSPDIVALIQPCWDFKPEGRPTMAKCQRAVPEARPDYRKVSAHFHGVTGVNPWELPEAFRTEIEGVQVTYNPDVEQVLSVASSATLAIPKGPRSQEMHCFAFSPDGKVVVAGTTSHLTCYTGSTIDLIQGFSLAKNVTPILACLSNGAEAMAYRDQSAKIHIFDRLAGSVGQVEDPPKFSAVSDMVFDYSCKHLVTFGSDNSLRVSRVSNASDEPAKRIASGIQSILDISPKHPVIAVAPYQDQIILLDIMEGKVLQVFETSGRAAFTPDGLSFVIQHPESGDPMIWEFLTAVPEASAFSLSPDGPRGRFVEVGRIQCPKSPSFRNISFSSDGLLGCGSYFEYTANPTCWIVHVWSLESRKTLLTMTFDDPKQTIRKVYLQPGSTVSSGHIDFIHQSASIVHSSVIQGSFGFRVEYSGTRIDEVPSPRFSSDKSS